MPGPIRVLHVGGGADSPDLVSRLSRQDDRLAVEAVGGAREALDRLDGGEFHCVVAEYELSGTDGVELLESVREAHPDLPFILYTGQGSEAVASDAISAGVTDYVQKRDGTDRVDLLATRVVNAAETYLARQDVDWHRTVIGNMGEGVYVLDADHVLQFVSYRTDDLGAHSESDWTGRHVSYLAESGVLSTTEVEWIEESADRLLAGEADEVRLEIEPTLPTDGEVAELRLTPVTVAGEELVLGTTRDITKRKERERELEWYETLVQETTDIITVLEADATVRYMSPSVTRVLGYDRADIEGDSALEYVHPDDRERVGAEFAEFVDSDDGAIDRLQYRLRHADGSWRWLESQGTRLATDLSGYVISSRDITERKRQEREREQYAAIADNMGDAAFIVDADRRIEQVNEIVLANADLPRPEINGRPVMEITEEMAATDADAERFEDTLETAFGAAENDAATVELDLDLPGGAATAEYNLSPVRIDGERKVVATARDVTDRKRREETLSTLHEVTREFMEALDQEAVADLAVSTAARVLDQPITALWLYDGDADALEPAAISEKGRELFDGAPTYERGEGLAWQAFESGEVGVYNDLRNEPERYNPDTKIQSEVLLPLGEFGVMAIGRPSGREFDDVDVTLARILANTVEAALARADRENQLRDQHRELQRQNERLDEFASIVSHDLRNPLQVLDASLDVAEETGEAVHFERARRSVDRMDRLISDVLTLAREGETITDTEPVALADLVESCWETVETEGAAIRVETDRVIRADRSRVKQLFENLMRNAVEHGGTDVTVTVGDAEGGFHVADDGPGIPEDEREAVFEAGYSTGDEGTGFGLSIVRQIADAHGWTVRVTDGAEGGARFEFTGVDVEG